LDCPENVGTLRQTILQLAVQGRLVRQHPGDELASVLLERIKRERGRLIKEGKNKREKSLEKIKELPYKMHEGWQLCQLGEISEIIMGNSPPGNTYNIYGDGVPLINGPTEFSKPPLGKTIVSQYTTQPTKFCKEHDLLICVRGATTGRTNIAGFDACIGRGVAVIRSTSIQSYLNLFILTKAQTILEMGIGSTFPSISQNDLLTILVPLPPLAEQHRIVAKVDALMALCDALEARLKERAEVQGRSAEAVVKSIEK
jgi:type I restriction enzyme, S subunit